MKAAVVLPASEVWWCLARCQIRRASSLSPSALYWIPQENSTFVAALFGEALQSLVRTALCPVPLRICRPVGLPRRTELMTLGLVVLPQILP